MSDCTKLVALHCNGSLRTPLRNFGYEACSIRYRVVLQIPKVITILLGKWEVIAASALLRARWTMLRPKSPLFRVMQFFRAKTSKPYSEHLFVSCHCWSIHC